MRRILITGAFGQLGTSLRNILSDQSILAAGKMIPVEEKDGCTELDITELNQVREVIASFQPDVIVHLAAMTDVDGCELNPELAFDVNVRGTENLLDNFSGRFIYISTDYVFDGNNGPYKEKDEVNPISVYGRTKLYGEDLVQQSNVNWVILRANVVFSFQERTKASFMDWVVDSLKNRQSITVVDDQWNNPTWTVDLARIISRIIDHEIHGLYHYGGRDLLNRFAFAEMIAETFKLDRTLIEPIDTASLKQLAKRPLKSGLCTEKIEIDLSIEALPLRKALNEIYSLS
jgi:dTDP-4-dehydrorhamnose reductase